MGQVTSLVPLFSTYDKAWILSVRLWEIKTTRRVVFMMVMNILNIYNYFEYMIFLNMNLFRVLIRVVLYFTVQLFYDQLCFLAK